MFRSLRTKLFAAALLLPLIAFSTATGGHWLRCRVTGAVLQACCCGDEAQPAATPPTATVSQADCCDRIEHRVSPSVAELTVAERAAHDAAGLTPSVEQVSIELISAPPRRRVEVHSSLGPPTGRLRLIAKSTLLI
jgi:hypothetical protein